jgi:hypothetical protein
MRVLGKKLAVVFVLKRDKRDGSHPSVLIVGNGISSKITFTRVCWCEI